MTQKSTPWRRLRRRWDKHFRTFDLAGGLIAGLVLSWAVVLRNSMWATTFAQNKSTAVFTAGSAVTGVLLGLTLAALTIIADHLSGGLLVPRAQGRQLVDAFISATYSLGVATVLALVGLVPSGITALKILIGLWVVAATVSIVFVIRSISLLGAIVRAVVDRGSDG